MLGVNLKKVFTMGCCPSASAVCSYDIFWVSFTKLPGEIYKKKPKTHKRNTYLHSLQTQHLLMVSSLKKWAES